MASSISAFNQLGQYANSLSNKVVMQNSPFLPYGYQNPSLVLIFNYQWRDGEAELT